MIMIDSQDGMFPAYVNKPADATNKTPGVIIIHEWWGLVPHVKGVADKYAEQGFAAIAPDLYAGVSASNPEEARKLSASVTTQKSKKMIDSTAVYLKALDLSRLGITGYCFGGTHAFNYVCESNDVSAGAIYYASRLPSEEQLAKISAPLLLIYGDQDHSVKPEQARQLELHAEDARQKCSVAALRRSSTRVRKRDQQASVPTGSGERLVGENDTIFQHSSPFGLSHPPFS